MSEVIQANVLMWRQKCADGSITMEEMIEAIRAIRKERVGAQETSTASKTKKATAKAKAAPIDSGSLLDDLDAI